MKEKIPVIIALGYFDSVHIGHAEVIFTAEKLAEKTGVFPAVFTFKNNLKKTVIKLFGDKTKNKEIENEKYVFSFTERKSILRKLNIKNVLAPLADKHFLSLGKTEFLDYINGVYDIKGYVCGEDYRFGKDGGGVNDLKSYASARGQTVKVVNTLVCDGEKVSTTRIKNLLSNGRIKEASALLTENFFISGEVKKDRGEGTKMGFPTVNIAYPHAKQHIKSGVYFGAVKVRGKIYKAVINCGARPTFGITKLNVEAFLLDFSGDLCGKKIRTYFIEYIRGIEKFPSENALIKQIEKDVSVARTLSLPPTIGGIE